MQQEIANVNVPQLPRRQALATLTENYSAALARAVQHAKIMDGTTDEKGNRMVRDYLPGERMVSATAMVMDFMVGIIGIRVEIEFNAGVECDNLLRFYSHAKARVLSYREASLGAGVLTVATNEQVAELTEFERTVARHIFAIMRNDMEAKPDLKEVDFWADVFLGMADADDTGIVGIAARLVFLDHREDFEAAHTADVLAQATGITRQ